MRGRPVSDYVEALFILSAALSGGVGLALVATWPGPETFDAFGTTWSTGTPFAAVGAVAGGLLLELAMEEDHDG